jgi:glycerol-3-phosphate acyltransferase PlsY
MPTLVFLLTVVVSYLAGAVPFGYLIGRARGVNIFVLGRRWGVLVFLLDFAKGAVPAYAAGLLARRLSVDVPHAWPVAAGLAAFLGHLFPVYLRFRGGKGVATGAGVVAVLLPVPALGALLTWVAVLCASRAVSLASLAAAAALTLFRLSLTPAPWAEDNWLLTALCFVATSLVFLRHRGNLTRLLRGTENRIEDSPPMLQFTKLLHVLAVGLWFGSAVFFSFPVALTLFGTLEAEASKPGLERPVWLPLPPELDRDAQTRKEQGSRAAGAAISPMFDWYFLIQGACGFLAVATALSWSGRYHGRVHRLRAWILILAVLTVVVGWPLERKVSELRRLRNATQDVVLTASAESDQAKAEAAAARAEFGRWHFYSLMLNFLTILLVTGTMGLTAWLPSAGEVPGTKDEGRRLNP